MSESNAEKISREISDMISSEVEARTVAWLTAAKGIDFVKLLEDQTREVARLREENKESERRGFERGVDASAEVADCNAKRSIYSWSEGPSYTADDVRFESLVKLAREIADAIRALKEEK